MEVYYLLEVFYPDGHAEEFDEQYKTARDAAEFGLNMLNQISHTEQFHGGNDDDDFGFGGKQQAYFVVIEVKEGKRRIAFDSRTR